MWHNLLSEQKVKWSGSAALNCQAIVKKIDAFFRIFLTCPHFFEKEMKGTIKKERKYEIKRKLPLQMSTLSRNENKTD
jgi:hypothetical protein